MRVDRLPAVRRASRFGRTLAGGLSALSLACVGLPGCENCTDINVAECTFLNVVDSCNALPSGACTAINIEFADVCQSPPASACVITNVPSCPGWSSSPCSEKILLFDGIGEQRLLVDLITLGNTLGQRPRSLVLVFAHSATISVLLDGGEATCWKTDGADPLWYEQRCAIPDDSKQLEIKRDSASAGEFWARLFLVPSCRTRSTQACAA